MAISKNELDIAMRTLIKQQEVYLNSEGYMHTITNTGKAMIHSVTNNNVHFEFAYTRNGPCEYRYPRSISWMARELADIVHVDHKIAHDYLKTFTSINLLEWSDAEVTASLQALE